MQTTRRQNKVNIFFMYDICSSTNGSLPMNEKYSTPLYIMTFLRYNVVHIFILATKQSPCSRTNYKPQNFEIDSFALTDHKQLATSTQCIRIHILFYKFYKFVPFGLLCSPRSERISFCISLRSLWGNLGKNIHRRSSISVTKLNNRKKSVWTDYTVYTIFGNQSLFT